MSEHYTGPITWSKINKKYSQIKIKYLVDVMKRKNQCEDPIVLSVTQSGIKIKDTVSGVGQQSLDYTKYQVVNKGDFVMNHMDLLTGYVDISKYDGVTSPDYRVFKIKNDALKPEFLLKLFQCLYKLKIFYGYGQGVSMYGRWRLVDINFQNMKIPVPSLKDQNLIIRDLYNLEKFINTRIQMIEKNIKLYERYNQSFLDNIFLDLLNDKHTKMIKLKYISKLKR